MEFPEIFTDLRVTVQCTRPDGSTGSLTFPAECGGIPILIDTVWRNAAENMMIDWRMDKAVSEGRISQEDCAIPTALAVAIARGE